MLSLQEAWAKWKELSDERPRIAAFTERPESRKCALDLYAPFHHGSLPAALREERGSQVVSRALSDTRNSDRVIRWARRSESGLRFSANAVTLSLSRLVACPDASAD